MALAGLALVLLGHSAQAEQEPVSEARDSTSQACDSETIQDLIAELDSALIQRTDPEAVIDCVVEVIEGRIVVTSEECSTEKEDDDQGEDD